MVEVSFTAGRSQSGARGKPGLDPAASLRGFESHIDRRAAGSIRHEDEVGAVARSLVFAVYDNTARGHIAFLGRLFAVALVAPIGAADGPRQAGLRTNVLGNLRIHPWWHTFNVTGGLRDIQVNLFAFGGRICHTGAASAGCKVGW